MFKEENQNGLIYLRSDRIPFPHAFTTRYGGVSKGSLKSLNLLTTHGDREENVRENLRRVTALLGAEPEDRCFLKQVHGTKVLRVSKKDSYRFRGEACGDADGLVTSESGMPIFCFTADCVPVLMCDEKARVIAAVHCGWRSSVGDILRNALEAMSTLGADIQAVSAAIGPSIGKCCFETDDDVPDAVTKWLAGDTDDLFFRRRDGKTMVDLKAANARRLIQLGVKSENIDISDECTFCLHDKYWSHRYTKGDRGGQAGCIMMPEA